MGKISKLNQSAQLLTTYESAFKCPMCSSAMQVRHFKSLVCQNNHSFDIAKQGYLNMLTNQPQTNYDRSLFEARQSIIVHNGFFDPMVKKLTEIMATYTRAKAELMVVDMGTGEGSLFNLLCQQLQAETEQTVAAFGLDIAKAGIVTATKNESDHVMWLVSDLARPPFQNQTFDILLNVLSPSNYQTFNDLLKDDGLAIKVVPRANYLRELRDFFHEKTSGKGYSNTEVTENFKDQFQVDNTYTVQYKKTLDPNSWRALIQMTPLTWHADEARIADFLKADITDITIDLEILVGRKK